MKIDGFSSLFREEGIQVLCRGVFEMSWSQIVSNNLAATVSSAPEVDPMRVAEKAPESRGARRFWSRHQEAPEAFRFKAGEKWAEVNGTILYSSPRLAARVLATRFEPMCDSGDPTPFERWFAETRGKMSDEEFELQIERWLNDSERRRDRPDYLCGQDETSLSRIVLDGAPHFFESGYGLPPTLTPLVHPSLPLSRQAHCLEVGEYTFMFDGERLHTAGKESSAAQRLFARMDEGGQAFQEVGTDFLSMPHVVPVAWLRLPTRFELDCVMADTGRTSAALRGLTVPDGLPASAYLYDVRVPVPMADPSAIAVIEDPTEAMAVLVRSDHGVFIADAPPTPCIPEAFADEPRFMLMAQIAL
jgi:hypothetical protein